MRKKLKFKINFWLILKLWWLFHLLFYFFWSIFFSFKAVFQLNETKTLESLNWLVYGRSFWVLWDYQNFKIQNELASSWCVYVFVSQTVTPTNETFIVHNLSEHYEKFPSTHKLNALIVVNNLHFTSFFVIKQSCINVNNFWMHGTRLFLNFHFYFF